METTTEAPPDLDNHHVVRDGSWWTCRYCGNQWPYPAPLPTDASPCTPRQWGPLCDECGAQPGRPCRDLRSVNAPAKLPHKSRKLAAK